VLGEAFDLAPDEAMVAVADVVEAFEMPGNEVEGFTRRSVAIAMAGIYDLRIHHDEVVSPVLRAWNVWERTDLGPLGEEARERLAVFMAGLDAAAARFEERRAARAARVEARA
jgi:acyl-[acyl-carrier-protein] desaturase